MFGQMKIFGVWTCIVKLVIFQIISGQPLTSKPQLTNSGSVIQVLEGDTVNFPCRTSNLEDFVVLWRKGPSVIYAGPIRVRRDERMSLSENDLVLKEVVAEDEGKYSCQVETGDEEPPSIVHRLEVLQRPVIKSQPENGFLVVKEGTSITLQCQAGGNPHPKITWRRNDQILGDGERLKVKKLSPEGSGDYFCTADNGVGEPVEFKFTVEVFFAPRVLALHQNLEPGKLSLICDIKSEPVSRVAWYHNGLHINPSLGISMGNQESLYKLVVEGDVRDVVGEYKCRAENRLGAGEQVMQVKGEPTVILEEVQNLGWDTYRVSWMTNSHLPVSQIRVKYRMIQDQLMGDKNAEWNTEETAVLPTQSSYDMSNLWSDSQYEVYVSAMNELGWGPETVTLFNTVKQTQEELQSMALELVSNSSSTPRRHFPLSFLFLSVVTVMLHQL